MCEGCFSLFTDDRVRFRIVRRGAKPYDKMKLTNGIGSRLLDATCDSSLVRVGSTRRAENCDW